MPVEAQVRKKSVHVREHFRHEVVTNLTAIVPQPIRMSFVSREQEKPDIFKCVSTQNDDPRLLKTTAPEWIDVLNAVGVTALVRANPDRPAMSAEIKIPSSESLWDRR